MNKLLTILILLVAIKVNAAKRYVATTGSNSNPGTIESPFLTVAYAARHSIPGDTIIVGKGIFLETERINLPAGVSIFGAGTSSVIQSTYVAGNLGDGILKLNRAGILNAMGQTISHLKFDGRDLASKRGIAIIERSNVIITDCTIQNFLLSGIAINYGGRYFVSGTQIHDCIINNCATDDNLIDVSGNSGSVVLYGINGMLFYNNNCTQNSRVPVGGKGQNGDILRAIDKDTYGLKRVKIYNNTFNKNADEPGVFNFTIEFWNMSDSMEIYNNTFNGTGGMDFCGIKPGTSAYGLSVHDNIVNGIANPKLTYEDQQGINFEDANGTNSDLVGRMQYIYCYNNYFNNLSNPLRFDFTISDANTSAVFDHIYVYNNVLCNFGYSNNVDVAINSGVYLNTHSNSPMGFDNIHIYNNTLYGNANSRTGIYWKIYNGTNTNFSIDNNIITGMKGTSVYFENLGSGAITTISIQNNDYHSNGTNTPFEKGITFDNKTELNSIATNPIFVSSKDYHLQPSSPCIDAGINVGLPFSGSAPDIGRYEF